MKESLKKAIEAFEKEAERMEKLLAEAKEGNRRLKNYLLEKGHKL